MNSIYQKIIKIERGCEISLTTPVETSRLHVVVRDVVEVVAAAEAECEVVVRDVILGSAALPTPPRLHFLVPRHRASAVATRPVGLLAEDSRIGLAPLLADVLPLWPVVKAHAVTTLTVWTLLTCKVAIVHSDPPFWPPIFLGANYYSTRNHGKVKVKQKTDISAVSYLKTLKVTNSMIKNFSFLLSKSPIRFCPENPIRISRRAKRGEPFKLAISSMVPSGGFEPPILAEHGPKPCASSSSATRAKAFNL